MTNKHLRLFTFILAVSFMFGCKSAVTVSNNSAGNANSGSEESKGADTSKNTSPTVENAKTTGTTSDKIESVYTDIAANKCKTIDSNEDEGWITQMCDGVGGYKLEVFEADIRQSINVIAPNGKKSELDFQANVSGSFSSLGEKAEWRVREKDGKSVPFALIARLNASNPDNETKSTSYLVVSKINADKSCITDVIKPSANANEEARKAADNSANKPCKTN